MCGSLGSVCDCCAQTLSRIWVERAARFVTDELTRLADGASSHTGSAHSAARLQTPDHSAFHERAEALAPLLQVPSSTPPLSCQSLGLACPFQEIVWSSGA